MVTESLVAFSSVVYFIKDDKSSVYDIFSSYGGVENAFFCDGLEGQHRSFILFTENLSLYNKIFFSTAIIYIIIYDF